MASLHFPDYFHEKLEEIGRLTNADKSIKFPIKNQFVLASFAILEYNELCVDIYKQSDHKINEFNAELKKLYLKFLKDKTFNKKGRDIPRSWVLT